MSIGFVLRATDGLVVVADDGLTSHAVINGPVGSDVAKIANAPHDLPFVVVALGRASVAAFRRMRWLTMFLPRYPPMN